MKVGYALLIVVVSVIITALVTIAYSSYIINRVNDTADKTKKRIMYASIVSVAVVCFIVCGYLGIVIVDWSGANNYETEEERQKRITDLTKKYADAKQQFKRAIMAQKTPENEKQIELTKAQMDDLKKQLTDLKVVVD